MTSGSAEIAPQTYARVGGMLYLFIILASLFGEVFVRGSLIVPRDPVATAKNIQAAEMLFRAGLAGEMLTCVCDVALAMILYVLLRPVSRNLALLAAFFRLTFIGIYSASKFFEVAALAALEGAGHLKAFNLQQLHDLAYVSLKVHGLAYGASLLFFGFCCVLFGYLIHRSGYLPRILGVLLVIAGVGYIVFSLAQILAPTFAADYLFPWSLLPGFAGELGLALWLTVKGVDVSKWKERAPD